MPQIERAQRLLDLPPLPLERVARHLDVRDLARLEAVSKPCRSAFRLSGWSQAHYTLALLPRPDAPAPFDGTSWRGLAKLQCEVRRAAATSCNPTPDVARELEAKNLLDLAVTTWQVHFERGTLFSCGDLPTFAGVLNKQGRASAHLEAEKYCQLAESLRASDTAQACEAWAAIKTPKLGLLRPCLFFLARHLDITPEQAGHWRSLLACMLRHIEDPSLLRLLILDHQRAGAHAGLPYRALFHRLSELRAPRIDRL